MPRFRPSTRSFFFRLFFLSFGLTAIYATAQYRATAQRSTAKLKPELTAQQTARVQQKYGQLPLRFEANHGQSDSRVNFVARGLGYSLFLTGDEAVFRFSQSEPPSRLNQPESPVIADSSVMRLQMVGASKQPRSAALEPMETKSNYFIGNDSRDWRSNVTNFGRVRYDAVYPGIDVVWYGNQRQLEYDFVVAPRALTDQIKLALVGAQSVKLDKSGDLLAETRTAMLRFLKPVAWQTINDQRREVDCRYRINAVGQIEFQLGKYDHSQQLVIDPILNYSTYVGGAGSEFTYGLAVDSEGDAFICGQTDSTDFPGTSPIQAAKGSGGDVFVLKLDPTGSRVVYATWLGGSGTDGGEEIALDAAGNVYVTGYTTSANFPTSNAFQDKRKGSTDSFVAKLNPAGSALVFSTYLSGAGSTQVSDLALDGEGNVYLTGNTTSPDFPMQKAFQPNRKGNPLFSSDDAGTFWKGINVSPSVAGATFIAQDPKTPSTIYLGTEAGIWKSLDSGQAWEQIGANVVGGSVTQIVIDPIATGNVYALLGGAVYKSSDGGKTWNRLTALTAFVTSLSIDPKNTRTLYAVASFSVIKTADGGMTWAALPNVGSPQTGFPTLYEVVVSPTTSTTLFAATSRGVFKSTDGGSTWQLLNNGFQFSVSIRRLVVSPSNPSVMYAVGDFSGQLYKTVNAGDTWTSTTLPTSSSSVGGFAVDPANSDLVYIGYQFDTLYKSSDGGVTWKASATGLNGAAIRHIVVSPLPSTNVYVATAFPSEAFVTRLNADGKTLAFSTYLGGDFNDFGYAIKVDSTGNVYVVGAAQSVNFPVSNSYQGSLKGMTDGFLTKFNPDGSGLLWSTYLGGDEVDGVFDLALTSAGSVVLVGVTGSENFPVVKAIQPTIKKDGGVYDAFVMQLPANGSKPDFSTYLGGSNNDSGRGIGLDAAGNIYVGGFTYSNDFPTVGAVQTTKPGTGSFPTSDAFMTKLRPDGSAINYSVFLGGTDSEFLLGMAVDAPGNVYVTGYTYSPDFPLTPNAPRKQVSRADAFITKLSINADLAITASDQPDPVMVGNPLTYTLSVVNTGPDLATNVTVTDVLPAGVSFVSATTSQGSCAFAQTVTCNLGNLADKATATVTVVVTPTAAGNLTNRATVASTDQDLVTSNNSASLETKVSASPSIYGRVTNGTNSNNEGVAEVSLALSGGQKPAIVTGSSGLYQFAELTAQANYKITPTRSGYVFTPPERTFTDLRNDQRADFTGIACVFSLGKSSQVMSAAGGIGQIVVLSPDRRCTATTRSNATWIKVTGVDPGISIAGFTVEPTITPRTGTVTVAGNTFTVYQEVNACAQANFQTAVTFGMQNVAVRDTAGRTVIKDFNSDGQPDMAFLTEVSGQGVGVALMQGDGRGGFLPQRQLFGLDSNLYAWLSSGDFNADGKLDLVASINNSSTTSQVIVALGNGTGAFLPPIVTAVASGGSYLTVGDFNGDKLADVAVAGEYLSSSSTRVAVLFNKGFGVLDVPKTVAFNPLLNGISRLGAADFNGDGKDDLVATGGAGTAVALGEGVNSFGAPKLYSTTGGGSTLQTLDFNGDGKVDVFSASTTTGAFLFGKGDGTLEAPAQVTLGKRGRLLLTEDVNSDGKFDLVGIATSGIILRLGRGANRYDDPVIYDNGMLNNSFNNPALFTAELNGDGYPELMALGLIGSSGFAGSSTSGSNGLSVLYSKADGSYAAPQAFDYSPPTGDSSSIIVPSEPVAGDLNGDGVMDVAFIYDSQRVAVAFGNGRAQLSAPTTYFVGQNPSGLKLADFNSDGNLDFIVSNFSSSSITIQLNNGRGEFPIGIPILTGPNSRSFGVADFNNDGKLDLLVKNSASGLRLLIGSGTGDFSPIGAGLVSNIQSPLVTVGDFNGDGNADAVTSNPDSFSNCNFGNGNYQLLFGDGRGSFTTSAVRTLAERPDFLYSADVNNDERSDLLFVSSCDFNNRGLFVALATANGNFSNPIRYDIGKEAVGPRALAFGEFNGDGKLDVAVSTSSSGNVSIMLGNGDGSFVFSTVLPIASKALLMAVGDFNEDGTNDLVVTRESGGISIIPNRAICAPANGVVATSAASFVGRKFSPESIVAVFGSMLATSTETAKTLPLPTTLGGIVVTTKNESDGLRLASLLSVSPKQINLVMPSGIPQGVYALNVIKDGVTLTSTSIEIVQTAPALFTVNSAGYGLPAAVAFRVKADGTSAYEAILQFDAAQRSYKAVPIDLSNAADQVFLVLFGSGVRNRRSPLNARAAVGGENADVHFVGKQGSLEGIDQINLRLPGSLRGRGEVEVALSVDGKAANPVKIVIK